LTSSILSQASLGLAPHKINVYIQSLDQETGGLPVIPVNQVSML
jgi:hypothetical protein